MIEVYRKAKISRIKLVVFICSLLLADFVLLAQAPEIDIDSISTDQVRAGNSLYGFYCASCHGLTLGGGEGGPALRGQLFESKWNRELLPALEALVQSTMPPGNAGALSNVEHQEVLAYLLYRNGYDLPALPAEFELEKESELVESRGTTSYHSQLKPVPEPSEKQLIEWQSHRSDLGSSSYSPLDIINRETVRDLEVIWRWKTKDFGSIPEFNYECTPLMVGGVLYVTAGMKRSVVALDAVNGETLWLYRLDEGIRGQNAPRKGAGRGVGFWQDSTSAETRIFVISPGFHLVALNSLTGAPIQDFGERGLVDLKANVSSRIEVGTTPIGSSSPPLVVGDVVIVGPAFPGGSTPPSPEMAPGYISGYDARTGERRWVFHLIPPPGEFGYDTWEDESANYTGNVGAWAPMSADLDRGLVYVPVEAATGDYYGGHRPGDNLFSQSLVCLDAMTGKRVWHFQLIHHGIWDYDTPAPPVLADVEIDGEMVPVVAQVTKQSFVYVFNRVTGEPIWPIEEKEVPQSNVPGEKTSPTQPIPTWPLPFDRQGSGYDDLIDFTSEIEAEAFRIASQYQMGPLYTPVTTSEPGGLKGSLVMPESIGGGNWQGGVLDPETNILFIPSVTIMRGTELYSDPSLSSARYLRRVVDAFSGDNLGGPFGLPLVKPPWGRITAIDLDTGEHIWMVPNANTPDWVNNHPKLKGLDIPRTGKADRSGLLVAKSLLFAGEGSGLYGSHRGGGNIFRALDKATGETIHEFELPANQSGMPMTYAIDDRQYIVLAIGGSNHPGELICLGLP